MNICKSIFDGSKNSGVSSCLQVREIVVWGYTRKTIKTYLWAVLYPHHQACVFAKWQIYLLYTGTV